MSVKSVKTLIAGGLAVTIFALGGCGDSGKSETPKDLNIPLPPPPVGSGGGKTKAPTNPAGSAN